MTRDRRDSERVTKKEKEEKIDIKGKEYSYIEKESLWDNKKYNKKKKSDCN